MTLLRPQHARRQAIRTEGAMGPSGTAGPPNYEVHLRGHLDRTWATKFPGLHMEHQTDANGTPLTILRGPITDEAELHGILTRIRDLGIPLLLVRREASTEGANR
jgi:hypothetical protein